ncbi:unnamed protein product [Acanthoscelides obtectus]|uniref:Uncharacterized protein n=1 Tax=Acanthoscelides obtectus TaxID=200917 RepID=A0A9P0VT69_ACAOB|nr:unnamed protein product [Acanthoscelides obtectus]CAK1688780.1 hypothetical protein AOBTE_LOCUS36878 [Acanthoscelides obtectus]
MTDIDTALNILEDYNNITTISCSNFDELNSVLFERSDKLNFTILHYNIRSLQAHYDELCINIAVLNKNKNIVLRSITTTKDMGAPPLRFNQMMWRALLKFSLNLSIRKVDGTPRTTAWMFRSEGRGDLAKTDTVLEKCVNGSYNGIKKVLLLYTGCKQNLNSDFTDSALGSTDKSPLPYGNFQLRDTTVQSIISHPRYGPK